jgi:hypothetical protein
MDFNSSVKNWVQSRPPHHDNEFTGFIKVNTLLDHRDCLMTGLVSEPYNFIQAATLSRQFHKYTMSPEP